LPPVDEHSHEAIYAEIKRLDQLRASDQLATSTALTAAEKAVAAALSSSDKAVDKSEIAQKGVNEGQNEFRATLRDQAATFMPRTETESLVRELRAALASQDDEIQALQNANSRMAGVLAVARFVGFSGLATGAVALIYAFVGAPRP
jgi:hypothetical protein